MKINYGFSLKVPEAGLEPARPQWSLDFKSNVSTNSTTRATLFQRKNPDPITIGFGIRAGNGTRTRDPDLGKVVLYQLSYSRVAKADANVEIFLFSENKINFFRPFF